MNKIRMTGLAALLAIAATNIAHADGYQYRKGAVGLRVSAANIEPSSPPAPVIPDEAVGVLTADTSPDFGAVTLNASATRRFTFTNAGNLEATGVFATVSATTGLAIVSNSCGTSAAPVTVPKDHTCSIVLTYGGATASSLSGASLSVSGSFKGSTQSIPLSGTTGNFNATAAWSSTFAAGGAGLVPADLAFGTKTTNTVNYRTLYLHNTGTNGAMAAGFVLSGDSSNFKIVALNSNSSGSTNTSFCASGQAVIAPDGQSTEVCAANDIAKGNYPYLKLMLTYTPATVGNHSITVTPVTNNGTVLPGAVTLTGRGEFNPTGAWSSTFAAGGTDLVPADLAFGTKTTDTVNYRTFYLRNTGTNGALAAGFTLTGGSGNFKIVAIRPNSIGSTNSGSCTNGSPAIAADGQSVGVCTAEDIAGKSNPYISLTLTYTPATVGNHSVTLTPVTNNGTALPGAITLTGRGEFNPTATWSSSYAPGGTALVAADLAFGTKTTNTVNPRTLYLRNTGTNGAMAAGFTLSGDPGGNFKIVTVRPNSIGSTNTGTCTGGSPAIAADGQSAGVCTASDIAGGPYPYIKLTYTYVPATVGNHSVTLTPVSNNGTALPGAITLTGRGEFNPTSAWSSAPASLVALTTADLSFGAKAVNSTNYKYVYLRNTGTNGSLAVGFTLSGDTSQFRLWNIKPGTPTNGTACQSGKVAADGLSATPCVADDIAGGSYPHVLVTLRYLPTAAGNHSITLTPYTTNGAPPPPPITLTGTAQ